MNIKKQYKITLRLSEKVFKEYLWNLCKIADIGDQEKNHKQFWIAFKSLQIGSLCNKSKCDHPDTWKPYF